MSSGSGLRRVGGAEQRSVGSVAEDLGDDVRVLRSLQRAPMTPTAWYGLVSHQLAAVFRVVADLAAARAPEEARLRAARAMRACFVRAASCSLLAVEELDRQHTREALFGAHPAPGGGGGTHVCQECPWEGADGQDGCPLCGSKATLLVAQAERLMGKEWRAELERARREYSL